MSVLSAVQDPVLEVTGVPAADILRRCAQMRSRQGLAPAERAELVVPVVTETDGRTSWRLVDFGEGTDAEFVHAAHRAILGRPPYDAEMLRRTADLRAGRSRMEILARLALSPEGRRVGRPAVGGVFLPALTATGRGVDRVMRHRLVGVWVRRSAPHIGRATGQGMGMARRTWRVACAVPVLGGLLQSAAVLPRLARLQREVEELRREIQALRQDRR
ncbi:MAG: hypothetical protein AB7F35_24790 [Acetobacteraceae bacterium]